MELAIGVDLIYRVYLHQGKIWHDGRWCVGVCDHDHRTLLICDTLRPADRVGVLCHEFWHAFEHAFGHFAHDGESRADLFALGMRQFYNALAGDLPLRFVSRLTYQCDPQPADAWPPDDTDAAIMPGEASLCDIACHAAVLSA